MDKRYIDKDLSQIDSKYSDLEQQMPLKKIMKASNSANQSQDKEDDDISVESEEDNSIASKQSVSLESDDDEDSPLEEYLKLG